eukprot:TRINITY_DN296_c0_g1_i2.p1 TRINITY_DN296_c0_g1~~TRINITY_DN296_c0_g1_i2.p1  ORF type:complete len:496 (-),score=153.67 TRINITY_DN296_c0_g1_i2:190-1677(-)
MARLDCSDAELSSVLSEIRNPKGTTNWAVFGYVPKTNKLKVVSKGDAGLAEHNEEMNDGKVLFGYLKFELTDGVCKFVFVAWCGEGVQGMAKTVAAKHFADFSVFLKDAGFGYHVQINARNENDLEEKDIIDKLNKAKGANFVQAKASTEDKGPDLKNQSQQYWTTEQKREAERKAAVQQRAQQNDQSLLQAREAEAQKISQQARQQQEALHAQREADRQAQLAELAENRRQEEERRAAQAAAMRQKIENRPVGGAEYGTHRTGSAAAPAHNVYRAQEAAHSTADAGSGRAPVNIPSGNAGNLKSRFENMTKEPAAPAPAPKKAAPPRAAPPPASKPAPPPPSVASKPAPAPPPAAAKPPPAPEPEPAYEESYDQGGYDQGGYDQGGYDQGGYDQGGHDQGGYDQGGYDQGGYDQGGYDQGGYDQSYDAGAAGGGGGGIGTARAVYDYEGEAEGDLAFREGDLITILDQSDPSGWWQGDLNGVVGFFPSNFVEMV